MSKSSQSSPLVAQNKKAHHKFEMIETLECGIVLRGTELPSIRRHRASLDEAFARIRDSELWLIGCHIPAYEYGGLENHDPIRPRKLLVHRRQLQKLEPKVTQRGCTLVPLRMYFSDRGQVKVEIALARGKTTVDKRQDIKKREDKREMDRAIKGRG